MRKKITWFRGINNFFKLLSVLPIAVILTGTAFAFYQFEFIEVRVGCKVLFAHRRPPRISACTFSCRFASLFFVSNVKHDMPTRHLSFRSYICNILDEQSAPVIALGAPQRQREKTL